MDFVALTLASHKPPRCGEAGRWVEMPLNF